MIPSRTWFPMSLQERVAWFVNFATQFQLIAVSLGFTLAEAADVDKEMQQMQFLGETTTQIGAYDNAFREYRKELTEGKDGDPAPAFPPNPTFVPPFALDTGIFERLVELVERIRVAPAYTPETGALLGIIPSNPESLTPGEVKPTISLSSAVHGYLFSVVISKREDADAWQVWVKGGGLENWQIVATATGKSTDVTFNPGGETPGAAQLEVYVQLRRNNANYGQPSDIALVTVNP